MPGRSDDTADVRVRMTAWILPVAAFSQLIVFGYFLVRTKIRPPFMDMLDWIVSYLDFRDGGGLGSYLWAFHNEHHLVWIRILVAMDVAWFHGSGIAFIVAGTASLLASAAAIGLFIRRDDPSSDLMVRAAWLAPMLIVTSANAADCGVPMNAGYPIAVFFMIGSLVLFESESNWRRALALPIAAGAAFGNGVGLVIWPVLVWVSWRQRTGLIQTAAVALFGLLFIGAYTHGMPSTTPLAAASRSDLFSAGGILKPVKYALAFLGLPFPYAMANRVGLAFLLAGLFAIARVSLVERANSRLNRLAAALILTTFGAAAIAAIGRAHLEPGVRIPLRYSVLVAPLHIGLLCFAIRGLGHRARTASGQVAVTGFAAALLAMQFVIARPVIRVNDQMRLAIQAYYQGDRDPEVTRFVYPDAIKADRMIARMRDNGLLGQE